MAKHLNVGAQAPEIHAKDVYGNDVTLSDLRGRYVLVYFYPMDDTPGCTAEACALNDNLDEIRQIGGEVIGVSTQNDLSHQKFREKYGLNFPLAADADGALVKAYGTGKMAILPLAARVSYLIAPDGTIAHVWPKVSPKDHAADVVAVIKDLSAKVPATA